MEIGKVPNEVLEKIVFANIRNKRSEVIVDAGVGKDCAVLDYGEYACVVSTDPITGASKNLGSLAVHISCNDIASSGAEPIGALMTILIPPHATEEDLETIMRQAGEEAEKLNIQIVGGHTEVTDAVNKIIITTTVIGKQLKSKVINPKNVEIGDKIVITKAAGIEGTSIIAHELYDDLKTKIDEKLLTEAMALGDKISVVREGMIGGRIGVNYMHDITEGGVLGAVWEASIAIEKGVMIVKESIKIEESTKAITELLGIDPYRLISSGSMLMIVSDDKLNNLKKSLEDEQIDFSIIGEVVESGISMEEKGETMEIESPGSDELYKVV